jgi:hypothetical protein
MSEAIGIAVRRRRSRVEAERLVLEFERSGLRRQAFCAQHRLSVAALDKYRKRCRTLEHPPTHPQPEPNRMLPVELVDSAAPTRSSAVERCRALWVELANGRRIEVAHGFDASTLERLVAVLERA